MSNRLLLAGSLLLLALNVQAQPWLNGMPEGRLKLEDIEKAYQHKNDADPYTKEGHDYHFERWRWNQQRHADEQGYLVSPAKAWEEAQRIKEANRAQHKNTSVNASWTFHGPDNPLGGSAGVGRINVIEFHPTDTNTYIIGSPGGGMWRSTNDGQSWSVLDDFLPVLGVSDIDYNPQNPNTIYACTGDRNGSDTYSLGILKSTDGGITWDTTGFTYTFNQTEKTNGLILNPVDTSSLTIATSNGIYKSNDAGVTWNLTQPGNFQQIIYNPADTNIIYASGFSSGSRQLHRSDDGGYTWNDSITNFPGVRRFEIAVTPANPAIVKIVTANSDYGLEGIYSSSDTGKTFTKIFDDNNCTTNILDNQPRGNTCGGQAWYDLSITISPVDSNLLIVGGVSTWYSADGGYSWSLSNQNRSQVPGVTVVHADKHFHKFHPLRPNILYECNDGGLHKCASPTIQNSIWNDLSAGLGITQFYRNAVSPTATFVLGGAQDNGTKRLIGGTSEQMTGSDGMDCHINPIDSTNFYTSAQYGELRRTTNDGNNFTDIQNNIPGRPDGSWITPFSLVPGNPTSIIAAYNTVYYSNDMGENWTDISPSFGANCTRLSISQVDTNYIYAIFGGSVRYSVDFGSDWKFIFSTLGSISDLQADPDSARRVWITLQSYTGNKVAMYDLDSTKWTLYNDGLPEIPVNCLAFDEINKTMYVGTNLGVYYREYHKTDWQAFNNGNLPNVEVIDLGINNTTGTIWAATYGRGMWSSPVHKSTVSVETVTPYAKGVIKIAPNPNEGSFRIMTGNESLQNSDVEIVVTNVAGSVVWKGAANISANGIASVNADLTHGIYIVDVVKENMSFARAKMVVQ